MASQSVYGQTRGLYKKEIWDKGSRRRALVDITNMSSGYVARHIAAIGLSNYVATAIMNSPSLKKKITIGLRTVEHQPIIGQPALYRS